MPEIKERSVLEGIAILTFFFYFILTTDGNPAVC